MTRIKHSSATALRVATKLMVLWGLAGAAHAACTLTTSATDLDMGRAVTGALPASDTPGYKRMGVRQLSINGVCDRAQSVVSLAFEGLEAVPGKPNAGLVRWGDAGALVFHIERATVDGAPVAMTLLGGQAAGRSTDVTLSRNETVELDLNGLPAQARKSFSLQLSLVGLLPDAYAVRTQVRNYSQFTVRLVGAQ
jgi:hypothetical protein